MRWIGMSEDGSQVVLNRFDKAFRTHCSPDDSELIRAGAVVDVETTGLEPNKDVVIEIGVRPFTFHRLSGELLNVGQPYTALQDPQQPLSEEVSRLTGLTDDDLRGHSIDWTEVGAFISRSDLVVAHNAAFDRPFIEAKTGMTKKVWGCSYTQIDWKTHGFMTHMLEFLCLRHGFYVGAHRALEDTDALLHLLTHQGVEASTPYLLELIENARCPITRMWATHAAFEAKDLLKRRGYRWNARQRTWFKEIIGTETDDELSWLRQEIYQTGGGPDIEEVSPFDRFR